MLKLNLQKSVLPMIAFVLLAGCSGSGGKNEAEITKPAEVKKDPVTLKLFFHTGTVTDEEFQNIIAIPVKTKFPHITLEVVRSQTNQNIQDLITSGNTPDIIYSTNVGMIDIVNVSIPADLTEQVKKNNIDLARFDPRLIDAIKAQASKGELYALPFASNFSALFYNKDIFDRFGLPYPKEGMTWEEAIDLSKKIGREENGVMFKGLEPNLGDFISSQLSLPFYDPKTDKAAYNTEGWTRFFNLYKSIMDVAPATTNIGIARDNFLKTRNLAMLPDFGSVIGRVMETAELNWDVTSFPVFKENPGVDMRVDCHVLMIYDKGKHVDESAQVIAHLLSDEVQTTLAKQGKMSSLNKQEIIDQFGADITKLKGKNIKAALKHKPAPVHPRTTYSRIAQAQLIPALKKVVEGTLDVNSALREADELANKAIATEKAKN
jgi:multiple sugar transport system substrate-binding protein